MPGPNSGFSVSPGSNQRVHHPLYLLLLSIYAAAAGCQSVPLVAPVHSFEHRISRDQLILHSDFSLEKETRLIEELNDQRQWLTSRLRLAATEVPIHVHLFDSEVDYLKFMHHRFPTFASRRAIFVEAGDRLAVYAHRGDHLADDLRHELSHGYLHAAIPHLPLWLDEGLAEYFEVGSARGGLNSTHVRYLRQQQIIDDWTPSLARLEQLDLGNEMTQADYAEAWVWVHFLLESEHDLANVLLDYLADLRQGGAGALLSTRLHQRLAAPELAVVEHLQNLP